MKIHSLVLCNVANKQTDQEASVKRFKHNIRRPAEVMTFQSSSTHQYLTPNQYTLLIAGISPCAPRHENQCILAMLQKVQAYQVTVSN